LVFRSADEPGVSECDQPLAAYWTYSMLIALLRFAACARAYATWRDMYRSRKGRLPIGPSLGLASAVTYGVMFVACGTNAANNANAASFSLLGVAFMPFVLVSMLGILRVLRLGSRMIPLSRTALGRSAESLETFDAVGRAIFSLAAACMAGASTALIIVDPAVPSLTIPLGIAAFALKGIYNILVGLAYYHQLTRCIRVVDGHISIVGDMLNTMTTATTTNTHTVVANGADRVAEFRRARNKLHSMRVWSFATTMPAAVLYFALAARAMSWTWYFGMGLHLGLETLAAVLHAFSMNRKRGGVADHANSHGVARHAPAQLGSSKALPGVVATRDAPAAGPEPRRNDVADRVVDVGAARALPLVSDAMGGAAVGVRLGLGFVVDSYMVRSAESAQISAAGGGAQDAPA